MALQPLIPELQAPPDPEGDALYSAELLIGCVLTEPRRYREVVFVKPYHFSHPGFGTVWQTLENLDAAGRVLEPAALIDAVGGLPEMVDFGGRQGLRDLFFKNQNAAMVRDHADAVVDDYARRMASHVCLAAAKSLTCSNGSRASTAIAEVRRELEAVEHGAGEGDAGLGTAQEAAEALVDALDNEARHGRQPGVMTGLRCVDRRLRGLRPGHLVVVGGRPSMGKTSLMRALAYGAAKRNPDLAFPIFSLEMTRRELSERALSAASVEGGDWIPYCGFGPALDPDDRARLRRLQNAMPQNVLIDDRSSVGLDDIVRRVWSIKARRPVGAVFIDYLQLLSRPPGAAGRNESLVLGDITRGLKALAGDAETCIVLLSQLNRGVESRDDKRPQLSDLRESGSIEQDANSVLFPYREAYYVERAEPKEAASSYHAEWSKKLEALRRRMDVIAAKNRGGSIGTDRQVYFAECDVVRDETE